MILFTKHAHNKFKVLEGHGFVISHQQVLQTINHPDSIDLNRLPLLIAQSQIDKSHVLRVVYKQDKSVIKVITFYPGRIKDYGK